MNTPTEDRVDRPATGNHARVKRYRSKHRRIDYVPSPAVVAIIEAWRARGLNNCLCGAIDDLVMAGDKAMSGNLVEG